MRALLFRALALFVLLGGGGTAQAAGGRVRACPPPAMSAEPDVPDLLVPSADALPAAETPLHALRARYTEVNLAILSLDRDAGAVRLALFPDAIVVADRDAQGTDYFDNVVWQGHIRGVPDSTVTLTAGNAVLTGTIALPSASFSIQTLDGPSYLVLEIDRASYPPD